MAQILKVTLLPGVDRQSFEQTLQDQLPRSLLRGETRNGRIMGWRLFHNEGSNDYIVVHTTTVQGSVAVGAP